MRVAASPARGRRARAWLPGHLDDRSGAAMPARPTAR